MKITSKAELVQTLADLGYRINEAHSFTYTNSANPGPPYQARAVAIVEFDTGLSFANVGARRDSNFKALQNMRRTADVRIYGKVYEL
jgi:hypothetical protein